MADRSATPLGTESEVLVSEELPVAQDDIRSIGKSVDTLLMELDQWALEAYMSSNSEGSASGRARRTRKIGSPKLSPEHAANNSFAKQSPEAIEPRHSDLPTVIGGSSPPVKRSRNVERRQRRRERRQSTAAVTIPSSPLDLNYVSYDKCVASLQSRPGPVQADDNLDPEYIWTSVHMNNNSVAPITGHTLERFKDTQRTNCKNSSMPRHALGCMHLLRDMHTPGMRISRTRYARTQVSSRRVHHMCAPIEGV